MRERLRYSLPSLHPGEGEGEGVGEGKGGGEGKGEGEGEGVGTQEGVVPHIYVNPSQQEGQGQVKGGVLSLTSNEDTEEKNNNKKKH